MSPKNVVVLIHGIHGDLHTWGNTATFLEESLGPAWDVDTFEYATEWWSKNPDIEQIARQLRQWLEVEYPKANLVLAGHSMGGLVAKQYILSYLDQGKADELKVEALFLVAVPNAGADIASIANSIPWIDKNQLGDLAPPRRHPLRLLFGRASDRPTFVEKQQREWNGRINSTASTFRAEVSYRLDEYVFYAFLDQYVPRRSSQGIYPDAVPLNGDHTSVVKPESADDLLVKSMVSIVREIPLDSQDAPALDALRPQPVPSDANTVPTPLPEPYQARLVVKSDGDACTAQWMEPDESDPFPLVLPLKAEDMADLRWYLETYLQFPGAGDHVRAQGIEAKFQTWGRSLFDSIFDNRNGGKIYDDLMEAEKGRGSSLLTIGATDPSVLGQPWELMRDDSGPLTFQGVTIRHHLDTGGSAKQYQMDLPLRVLLIVSRPSDIDFIDPRNSISPLLDALAELPPGQVSVDFCDPPTLVQLEETISQARRSNQPYHIVHFDGHGTYLPLTGVGALAFEKDDATTDLVTGVQLGEPLVRLDVPLVLLEACRSSDLSGQDIHGSVAPALIKSGVGSVIAFSHSVHVEAARLLVERFYQGLVDGLTIGQALDGGRSRLNANRSRWLHRGPNAETIDLQDWFIPQLYQVGDDLALFPRRDGAAGAATAPVREPASGEGNLEGFPTEPIYHFHGRAMELLELERDFRSYRAVLLSGMGGMGKTALAREAAAWWLRTGRFDSAVFCSFEQKGGADRVVQLIGQTLEGDRFSSRSADDQWTTAVSLFHQSRVLVVWDNFESTLPIFQRGQTSTADVEPAGALESPLEFGNQERARLRRLYRELTDGSPQGRLLVTCRPADTNLPGIKELALRGLARPDSLHLLAAVTGLKGIATDRPGYERPEIDALLETLDDHPLSIELVAPHLKLLTPARIRDEFGPLLSRFTDETAEETRNRSLLASLEFSKARLSDAAQNMLPYLAWFEGGVHEMVFQEFAELEPEDWEPVREELIGTALVAVDEGSQIEDRPYLRFHPTLRYAASPEQVPDLELAEQRFIDVYRNVAGAATQALQGNESAIGMSLLAREEANLRAAIDRAFRRGDHQGAGGMAHTLRLYLERASRLRERDALVAWLRAQLPEGDELDEVSCESIRAHAWGLFTQGHAAEAVQAVEDLITRLETEGLAGGADPTLQVALSHGYLGRILDESGRSDLALAPLQRSIAVLEQLGDARRQDLSAALGDLANVYTDLGRLDPALEAAEGALEINRDLGHERDISVGLGLVARVLMEQQRYTEADARYAEGLGAAKAAGDLGLQRILIQHQGILQGEMGNWDRAIDYHKQALTLFQRAGDRGSDSRMCSLLGGAERRLGHFDAAEAWYDRSRELAEQLKDRPRMANVAHDMGILYQSRAEQETDQDKRAALLRRAVSSVDESLAIKLEMENQVGAASSYGQLGILHRMLGDLDLAEENVQKSLKIHESLNLPYVYVDYANLAEIARQRGDQEAAAGGEAKYDAKLAELQRLRRGEIAAGESGEEPNELA